MKKIFIKFQNNHSNDEDDFMASMLTYTVLYKHIELFGW